tara:strand:+ start:74 stop:307 length:234 start_codon:yes stop_codon:yes gene_type:complete
LQHSIAAPDGGCKPFASIKNGYLVGMLRSKLGTAFRIISNFFWRLLTINDETIFWESLVALPGTTFQNNINNFILEY